MTKPIPCERITWSRFHALCRRLARKIRDADFAPDLIVAIGRGGYMPGRVLSDLLGQPNLTSFKIEHYRGCEQEPLAVVRYPLMADLSGLRVLLVDDVDDSGDTLCLALDHLRQCGTPTEVRTAVLHHKRISRIMPDFHAQEVRKWRWLAYPWATTEDVRTLVRKMTPSPDSIEDAARRLEQEFGLRVAKDFLGEILATMDIDAN